MNAELATSTDACAPIASHAIGEAEASTISATLKALSDPLRLRMLSAIAADPRGESCVCDLAALADVSQPTVSHHLKVLRDVDVLTSERRGTWVWYRITPGRQRAVTALLESFAPTTVDERGGVAAAPAAAPDFDRRVTRLAEELAAAVPQLHPQVVLTVVRESYTALARNARAHSVLIPLTERFARQRLSDLVKEHDSGAPQVLFVCVANAGRSQLAAALVNRLSGGSIVARSAGSDPADVIHPRVRSVLAGIEGELAASDRFPKPLTDDAIRAADVVITMGCGDVCPIVPGVRYEDWAVGDPALASEAGIEAIRADIEARARTLVDELTHRPADPHTRRPA